MHNNDYLEICRSYQAIYDTPSVKEDSSNWTPVSSAPGDVATEGQIMDKFDYALKLNSCIFLLIRVPWDMGQKLQLQQCSSKL